eukprot:5931546-Prymnesium_polylepis.1
MFDRVPSPAPHIAPGAEVCTIPAMVGKLPGLTMPWCCTGRSKKKQASRTILPSNKVEAFQPFVDEDDEPPE